MTPDIYKYQFSKIQVRDDRAKYLIQYLFEVNTRGGGKIDYALNFYKYRSFIYITDFFPLKWENDKDCFHKLLSSEEGIRVNFRKIAVTCFLIFHQRISILNNDAAFVVSGSYIKDEKPLQGLNYSRKLKLYDTIFRPVAAAFDYRIVEVFDHNAIILIKTSSKLTDHQVRSEYLCFKQEEL